MKKIVIKNLVELLTIILIFLIVTGILGFVTKKNGFTETAFVYIITVIVTKIGYTFYECRKDRKNKKF